MAGDIEVKKRLTGFLLDDVAAWCGFSKVPRELKLYMGVNSVKYPMIPVLDRAEAKKAMAYCYFLLGKSVVERLEAGRTVKFADDGTDPSEVASEDDGVAKKPRR